MIHTKLKNPQKLKSTLKRKFDKIRRISCCFKRCSSQVKRMRRRRLRNNRRFSFSLQEFELSVDFCS